MSFSFVESLVVLLIGVEDSGGLLLVFAVPGVPNGEFVVVVDVAVDVELIEEVVVVVDVAEDEPDSVLEDLVVSETLIINHTE